MHLLSLFCGLIVDFLFFIHSGDSIKVGVLSLLIAGFFRLPLIVGSSNLLIVGFFRLLSIADIFKLLIVVFLMYNQYCIQ